MRKSAARSRGIGGAASKEVRPRCIGRFDVVADGDSILLQVEELGGKAIVQIPLKPGDALQLAAKLTTLVQVLLDG